ncbi:hypothetical protein L1887_20608 [Cichorium endivia]|nr:hypothetical protein L1887_20608 [Cichorium endivia]
MGGVEANDPPSKHRKARPLASSSTKIIETSFALDSSMAESLEDDKKLANISRKKSCITLSSSEFTRHIIDGNWDESLNSLRKIISSDESVVKSSCFVILEQKFLELLDEHKVENALRTLRNEISPLAIYENRVRGLSFILLFSNQEIIKSKPRSEHHLTGHKDSVSYVSWSPDDNQLLTCGVEEVVRRWDVFSGKLLFVYDKKDLGMIFCGQKLLVNQEIHPWGIARNIEILGKYKGLNCSQFVIRACLSGVDEGFVASGSEDSCVFIWYM